MKSHVAGKNTLRAEVTQIDKQGIWLLLNDKELFFPFENFPWFRNAAVSAIHNVQLLNERHLHWRNLDIDPAVESIEHPERFPLVAKLGSHVCAIAENLLSNSGAILSFF